MKPSPFLLGLTLFDSTWLNMGNSSSAKNRHVSGEDTAPTLTTSRFDTGTGFKFSAEADIFDQNPGTNRVSLWFLKTIFLLVLAF